MGFTAASVALLDRLVKEGEVEGWKPSKVQNNADWVEMFGNIPPGTFRSRLTRIRSQHGKAGSRGRGELYFYCF